MKNKILPALRIETELDNLVHEALQTLNENKAGIKIKLEEFRRWAYRDFSNRVITEGIVLELIRR